MPAQPIIPWRLYLAWVLANTVAWLLVFLFFGRVPLQRGGPLILEGWQLLLVGAAVALAQWLVLRQHLPLGVWWVFLNIVAWGLGSLVALLGTALLGVLLFPVTDGISPTLTRLLANLLFAALSGAVLGGVQWITFILHTARANWWPLASTAGVALAGMLRLIGDSALQFGIDVSWFAYSLVTGVVLVWMLDPAVLRPWQRHA